jgi:hypothetical protein
MIIGMSERDARQFVVRVLDVAQGAGALVQVDDQPPRWLSTNDALAVDVPVPSPDAVLLNANAFHAVRAAERRLTRAVEDGTRPASARSSLIEGIQDALVVLQRALRGAPPSAGRWAAFDDYEVDELHYGLIDAESEDPSPDSNSRRRRLIDELASEAERRGKPGCPEPKGSGRDYRQVSRLEAGLTWSPRDNIDHSHASDLSAWSSYNHTRREFVDDAAEPEKADAPERWSRWSDEELDRLGQMLGDGGHELADLRAEVRRRHAEAQHCCTCTIGTSSSTTGFRSRWCARTAAPRGRW